MSADERATAGEQNALFADRREKTAALLREMKSLPQEHPQREELRHAIIEDHMAYARHLAVRYGGRGEISDDFVQVAYLGLVKAVDNFDPDFGTGFLGYATPVILGEIKRYFRDSTWDVHVPRRLQELSMAMRAARLTLTQELGRSPTIAELAEKLDAEPHEITEALDAASAYTSASLDRPLDDGDTGSGTLAEVLGGDDGGFEAVINREALKFALGGLDEREKRILLMRFFRGMTQSQIGEELNISQMQVSRLLSRILGQLRDGMEIPG